MLKKIALKLFVLFFALNISFSAEFGKNFTDALEKIRAANCEGIYEHPNFPNANVFFSKSADESFIAFTDDKNIALALLLLNGKEAKASVLNERGYIWSSFRNFELDLGEAKNAMELMNFFSAENLSALAKNAESLKISANDDGGEKIEMSSTRFGQNCTEIFLFDAGWAPKSYTVKVGENPEKKINVENPEKRKRPVVSKSKAEKKLNAETFAYFAKYRTFMEAYFSRRLYDDDEAQILLSAYNGSFVASNKLIADYMYDVSDNAQNLKILLDEDLKRAQTYGIYSLETNLDEEYGNVLALKIFTKPYEAEKEKIKARNAKLIEMFIEVDDYSQFQYQMFFILSSGNYELGLKFARAAIANNKAFISQISFSYENPNYREWQRRFVPILIDEYIEKYGIKDNPHVADMKLASLYIKGEAEYSNIIKIIGDDAKNLNVFRAAIISAIYQSDTQFKDAKKAELYKNMIAEGKKSATNKSFALFIHDFNQFYMLMGNEQYEPLFIFAEMSTDHIFFPRIAHILAKYDSKRFKEILEKKDLLFVYNSETGEKFYGDDYIELCEKTSNPADKRKIRNILIKEKQNERSYSPSVAAYILCSYEDPSFGEPDPQAQMEYAKKCLKIFGKEPNTSFYNYLLGNYEVVGKKKLNLKNKEIIALFENSVPEKDKMMFSENELNALINAKKFDEAKKFLAEAVDKLEAKKSDDFKKSYVFRQEFINLLKEDFKAGKNDEAKAFAEKYYRILLPLTSLCYYDNYFIKDVYNLFDDYKENAAYFKLISGAQDLLLPMGKQMLSHLYMSGNGCEKNTEAALKLRAEVIEKSTANEIADVAWSLYIRKVFRPVQRDEILLMQMLKEALKKEPENLYANTLYAGFYDNLYINIDAQDLKIAEEIYKKFWKKKSQFIAKLYRLYAGNTELKDDKKAYELIKEAHASLTGRFDPEDVDTRFIVLSLRNNSEDKDKILQILKRKTFIETGTRFDYSELRKSVILAYCYDTGYFVDKNPEYAEKLKKNYYPQLNADRIINTAISYVGGQYESTLDIVVQDPEYLQTYINDLEKYSKKLGEVYMAAHGAFLLESKVRDPQKAYEYLQKHNQKSPNSAYYQFYNALAKFTGTGTAQDAKYGADELARIVKEQRLIYWPDAAEVLAYVYEKGCGEIKPNAELAQKYLHIFLESGISPRMARFHLYGEYFKPDPERISFIRKARKEFIEKRAAEGY